MKEIVTSAKIEGGKVYTTIKGKPAHALYLAQVILKDTAKALKISPEQLANILLKGENHEAN